MLPRIVHILSAILAVLTVFVIFAGCEGAHAQGTLPAVSVTAPANSSTITRTVLVAATATASQGIASVQFQLDGTALGSTVTGSGSSYSMSWDTTAASDGPHTLSTLVVDKANNQATSSISVTVANQIALNQRIQAVGTASVYASASLSSSVVGTETNGAVGTVVGGPSSDGQNSWWQINYDNGSSGWSTAAVLQPLPLISITPNAWVPVQPTFIGAPNGGQLYPQGWGNKGSYDPATHRIIFSDRWADPVRGYISIFANGIHAFDPALNIFTVVKLNNWYAQVNPNGGYTTTPLPANTTDPTPPDHHPYQLFEFVPRMNAIYTVNGTNSISLPDPSILNKTWKLDFGTTTWTTLSTATSDPNYPPNNPSNASGVIYEPINDKLVYLHPTLCGCNGTVTYLFDLNSNTWSTLPQDPSALPVNISGAGATYDSKRDLIWAYGGNNYNTGVPGTAHLWAYSVTQNKWTQKHDAPVGGTSPGFAYDSKHDIFLALVGNNTYIYNPNTDVWTQFPATLNRPASIQTWQGVTYDPAHDLFVFEGGSQVAPIIALFRYDPTVTPTLTFDATSPTVSVTSPGNNATVTGTITVSATASDVVAPNTTDSVGINGVQFLLDGAPMAGINAGAGPSFSIGWNTAGATNGSHTLTAIAYDEVGNSATASISITVSNAGAQPVISAVSASSVTASGAVINWTTDQASDSQVAYGLTSSYGSTSSLGPNLVTTHSVMLSGLAASTAYHYQVLSRNSSGYLGSSGDLTFTTAASQLSPLFLLHADATEVSGITNGSTITPSTAPSGMTGSVVVRGSGSVNYAPAQVGNGVYFLNCCTSSNTAYYKFTGPSVGSIFNASQGQVSFFLKSRYSFAQRQTSAAAPRYAFDVRDGNTSNHLFFFQTQVSSGSLVFGYRAGGNNQFYSVTHGTEDTLFGVGVIAKVTIVWGGGVTKLYLNDVLVQTVADTTATPNWTSASNFDIGAYEYLTFGGFNTNDDVVDEFSVSGPAAPVDTTPPSVSITTPAAGATVSGTTTIMATASDDTAVMGVQFQLDGVNLGASVTGSGPSYSYSWDSTTASNGTHILTAIATDSGNLSTTSAGVSVTVSNVVTPPVISAVSANPASTTATITWTTDKGSSSQVAYGQTNAYGTLSALATALVTSHSVTLTGLQASTAYHYQVQSKDSAGNLSSSVDFTFTTTAVPVGPQPLFLLHADATEVSGITNGSTITPSTAPSGMTGSVVVRGSGSVNYAPAQVGNGVYFLNCCTSSNTAYYKFTGPSVGSIFNASQGQVSFFLKSRYSFAQRQTSAAAPRYAFDVRDGNTSNHLFFFQTQVSSGSLVFGYRAGGNNQFYSVTHGTEDTLFGVGVIAKVTIVWGGGVTKLYLNDVLVQTVADTTATPNWTSASNFDIGAYEYLTFGGFNTNDDVVDEFSVSGPAAPVDTTPPSVSITTPAAGATVSGTTTIMATASDDTAVMGVQFQLDGVNLGASVTGSGPSYSYSWDSTTASNGTHILTAIATDSGNLSTTSAGVSVTVSNVVTPPVISAVSANPASTTATITWTTDKGSSSQVAYGQTNAYGTLSALATALVTSHSVTLTGLQASTAYHYQVQSKDSAGNLSSSVDFTFTTTAVPVGPQPLFLLHADATEVSGITNGSTITPSTAPSGMTGSVVVRGSGSVNYAPAQVGNGVYFLNCCTSSNTAYYKFTGPSVGSIFNASQGQVSFFLKSRYSFAQRQTSAAAPRYAFDVRDGNTSNHLFFFQTQVSSGSLVFGYRAGGNNQFYSVTHGTEDTLFGVGVIAKVTIVWGGGVTKLYLNDVLVQTVADTTATPNWTSASNFDIGAYEYLTFGGFNTNDDVVDEFSVGPSQ